MMEAWMDEVNFIKAHTMHNAIRVVPTFIYIHTMGINPFS